MMMVLMCVIVMVDGGPMLLLLDARVVVVQVKEMKDVITRRHEDYIACLQRFLALKRGTCVLTQSLSFHSHPSLNTSGVGQAGG
jgi:hypothetical protein